MPNGWAQKHGTHLAATAWHVPMAAMQWVVDAASPPA
jgi:hypothetical protein